MTGVAGQRPMMPPCPKCAGLGGVHWLTCPTLQLPSGAPVCSCGHLVVDDRSCACISRCPTCASEDCCAETWALYERRAVTVPP